MNKKFNSVNDYMSSMKPEVRKTLQAVRKSILYSAKGFTESISYGIPAFNLKGKAVVYFAGFKNHCSLYPITGNLKHKILNKPGKYNVKASTLQYEIGKPLPLYLIKMIVKERIKNIQIK
ncbi:MAG: DUF1801 domain-containing protein [Ignavibacteria bacterium]|nr:DUF1801 domain-containing protein [Ignavibacteria bacterium]